MTYIVSIDQGTTGSTVAIIDDALRLVAKANTEYKQIFPKPGWVEHNPDDIWQSVLESFSEATQTIAPSKIAAIGITNQRETTVIWERESGRVLHNAIVWQDRRTSKLCQELKSDGLEPKIRKVTGLLLDPYFSATKMKWLLDELDLRTRAENGDICIGTIDTYLIWKLTGGASFVTDATNASRTMLFDIEKGEWSDEMLKLFGIPKNALPKVVSSSEVVGTTVEQGNIPAGISISGIAGDQQSALFGQACFSRGMAKCTYGTGAFILMNAGAKRPDCPEGLLTTLACHVKNTPLQYALEGSAFIAGAAVQWLRDGLGLIDSAKDIEALALTVDSSEGVLFVPAFAGLGAPYWRPDARATITGLTRGSGKGHIARACLEGIAMQISDILQTMTDAGIVLDKLRVDGGAAANNLLMQMQADTLGVGIDRPKVVETTALGAAALAGLAVGVWPDQAAVATAWQNDRSFTPTTTPESRALTKKAWTRAIEMS